MQLKINKLDEDIEKLLETLKKKTNDDIKDKAKLKNKDKNMLLIGVVDSTLKNLKIINQENTKAEIIEQTVELIKKSIEKPCIYLDRATQTTRQLSIKSYSKSVEKYLSDLEPTFLKELDNLKKFAEILNQDEAYKLIMKEAKYFKSTKKLDTKLIKSEVETINVAYNSALKFLIDQIRDRHRVVILNSYAKNKHIQVFVEYSKELKNKLENAN